MTLTLTANIDDEERFFGVTGTVPLDLEPGYRFRIGDELLELQGFVLPNATTQIDRNRWYVKRGQDLSTASSHTAGDEIKGAADAFVSGSGIAIPGIFPAATGQTADVQAALDGANAPDAGNVFATMADVPGGSFTPTSLSGLSVWLDASQLALPDASPVANWPDMSGNGNDAVQAASDNQPVCKTAVRNGQRVVRFDPAVHDQYLSLPTDLFTGNAPGFTVALVCTNAAAGVQFRAAGALGDGIEINCGGGTGEMFIQLSGTPFQTAANATGVGWLTIIGRYEVGAMATCLMSGTEYGGDQSTDPHPSLPDDPWSSIGVGGEAGNTFSGDIAEVVVYARPLSASEQRRLFEYLSDKWTTL